MLAVRRHWSRLAEPFLSALGGLAVLMWVDHVLPVAVPLVRDLLLAAWVGLMARLTWRVMEWRADWFVVTGGKLPNDNTTEAEVARGWAIAHGVPPNRILAENEGRTTLESLEAVRTIFREGDLRTGLFVSDETHMLRVLRMAEDLGIEAFSSPTRTSPSDRDDSRRRRALLHEIAGLAVYYVGGGSLFGDAATASSP